MASIPEAAVVWKLKSVSAVTALTGADGIYTRIAPQGVDEKRKPYIVVTRAEQQRTTRKLAGPDSLLLTRLTLYCCAESYETAMAVAAVVIAALDPSPNNTVATWSGLTIDYCKVTAVSDASTPPNEADEIGLPIVSVDIDLFHLNC